MYLAFTNDVKVFVTELPDVEKKLVYRTEKILYLDLSIYLKDVDLTFSFSSLLPCFWIIAIDENVFPQWLKKFVTFYTH